MPVNYSCYGTDLIHSYIQTLNHTMWKLLLPNVQQLDFWETSSMFDYSIPFFLISDFLSWMSIPPLIYKIRMHLNVLQFFWKKDQFLNPKLDASG